MSAFDDDDVDFSGPTTGLSAVPFGSTRPQSASVSSTSQQLQQQQQQQANGAASQAAALLSQAKPMVASAVDAFRFVGNQYQPQGKVGLSLLGVAASRQYIIIVYKQSAKGEKVPLTLTMVGEKFKFIVRSDNYASFYDDAGCNWAARFDSADSLATFCLQVTIARAMSNPKQQQVIQDVLLGPDGTEPVGDGWKVECNYTQYNLASNEATTPVQVQTQQKQRVKAAASKAGLSQILIGMGTPGGRRIGAYLQPDGNFVIYDITVLRAKSPSPAAGVPSDNSSSTSELESSQGASSGRGGILSRMARLGQHVLPGPEQQQAAEEAQTEYSDPESVSMQTASPSKPQKRTATKSSEPPFVPARTHVTASVPTTPGVTMVMGQTGIPIPTFLPQSALATKQQIAVYQSPIYAAQQPQILQQPDMTSPLPQPGVGSAEWSVLFMETRQNSTEMRVILSKLQDKLDGINQRLDQQFQQQVQSAASFEAAGGVLDGRSVLAALQRMVVEEERLREELKARQDKIEQLNLRVSELLTDKQRLIEQSSRALSDRSDALSTTAAQSAGRVLHLEEEKANLALRVSTLTAEVSDLHLALAEKRRSELELRNEVIAMKDTVASATKSMEESAQNVRQMEAQLAVAKDSESSATVELNAERKKIAAVQLELAETKKQLETAQSVISAKESSLAEMLSKASEDQSVTASRARSLEDEISRLQQDLQVARSNVEKVSDQLRAKMTETQALTVERDRINDEKRHNSDEMNKMAAQITEQKLALETAHSDNMSLRSELNSLKEEYEAKLGQLESTLTQEQQRYQSLALSSSAENVDAMIAQQVKTIMNSVYQTARGSINAEDDYNGTEVLKTLLAVIKQTTLGFLGKSSCPVTVSPAKPIERKVEETTIPVAPPFSVQNDKVKQSEPEIIPSSPQKVEDEEKQEMPPKVPTPNNNSADSSSPSEITINSQDQETEPTVISPASDEADEHLSPPLQRLCSGDDAFVLDNNNGEENDEDVQDFPQGIAPVYITPEGAPESEIVPVHRDHVVPEDSQGRPDDFLNEREEGETASPPPLPVVKSTADPLGAEDSTTNEEENAEYTYKTEQIEEPAEPVQQAEQTQEVRNEDNFDTSLEPPVPEAEAIFNSEKNDIPNLEKEVEQLEEEVVDPLSGNGSFVSPPEVQQQQVVEKIAETRNSLVFEKKEEELPSPSEVIPGIPKKLSTEEKIPRKQSLFGGDSDSDSEDLFGAKPPPTPAMQTPSSANKALQKQGGSDNNLSIFEQSKVQEEQEKEAADIESRKQSPPPVPTARGGALFSDTDDDDGEDWFSSKK